MPTKPGEGGKEEKHIGCIIATNGSCIHAPSLQASDAGRVLPCHAMPYNNEKSESSPKFPLWCVLNFYLIARCRWEGRPPEAEFVWDDVNGVEVLPSHDAWLQDLDMMKEGLDALIEPELMQQNPQTQLGDLKKVKELLVRHAGAKITNFRTRCTDC